MGRISGGQRIGLLGGTFDPPHFGHLWLAEAALTQLNLDRILFLPVGEPPHKADKQVTSIVHRQKMTQLAIQDCHLFELDMMDADRPLPHITKTLLPLMHQAYPDTEFWMLMGSDSLRDLPSWHEPQRLIQMCRLAVLPRYNAVINWPELETAVPKVRKVVDWLEGPLLPLSSSELRAWAKGGNSLRFLIPVTVWKYIETQDLY